jgi:hypothetical protein
MDIYGSMNISVQDPNYFNEIFLGFGFAANISRAKGRTGRYRR